ncbi:oxygenase MpaB family protein [Geodermatophilus sp. SYSU D00700]
MSGGRPSARDWTPEEDRLGFFGPDSITWRVHADPVYGVGGLRALLLQALHPVAMDGVARNSVFRESPWQRLARTGEYVDTLTFGSRREAIRLVRRVRGMHRRLGGTEGTTGRTYRVDDPDLLLWVHACQVDSLLDVARRADVVTPAEADRYVAEQVVAAELIGADAGDVPASVADLEAYFTRMRPALALTPDARDAWRFIALPPMPRWVQLLTPARPAWGTLASLAVATLPPWARRLASLPGFAVTDAAATAALRAFRTGLLALPDRARLSPVVRAGFERTAPPTALGA